MVSLWNFTPVQELNGQSGAVDLGTLSECDRWSLIELVSFSGLPWDAHVELSRHGNTLPTIKISVSGLSRVCVAATSAKVYAINQTSETHQVQALVSSIEAPIRTENVYIELLETPGGAVTPPPGALRLQVVLSSTDPALRAGVEITTTNRFSVVTRKVLLDQVPEDGLYIGSDETVAVTVPVGERVTLIWVLAF